MRPRDLTWSIWLALALLPTSFALAGEPLLVVVEAKADVGVSAEEIRADVAAELGGSVVGPTALEGGTGAETLIIEIDARTAVLAFQPRDGAIRRRRIDLPADGPGRRKFGGPCPALAAPSANLVARLGGLPGTGHVRARPSHALSRELAACSASRLE